MSEDKTREIKLRIKNIRPGSQEEMVVDFLRSRELMPMRQLLLATLKMCWLPFSYRQKGADAATQQKAAREAVYQLQHHLNYLVQTFELDEGQGNNGKGIVFLPLPVEEEEEEKEELPGEYDLGGLEF